MVHLMASIQENIVQIRQEILKHAPEPESVRILGVTKFQPEEKVVEALKNGIQVLGVNYAQEGAALKQSVQGFSCEWHFIGHIQSRKTKFLIEYDCVESLDRLEIAEKLNRLLLDLGKTVSVLVEVNIGQEPQKSGVMPEEVRSFCKKLKDFSQLKLAGLMTMPPFIEVEKRRPFFQQLFHIYQELRDVYGFNTLSMGTSEDYPVALEEGSNLIRIGTQLFGERPQPQL